LIGAFLNAKFLKGALYLESILSTSNFVSIDFNERKSEIAEMKKFSSFSRCDSIFDL